MQIEGKKRWRVYEPKSESEYLPRYSSPNFSQKDLGKPILDVVLNPGDLLYFPRGYIHQGDTIGLDVHSLHITISAYQKNSWGDFLEKLLPNALQQAIKNDVTFREGLPLNFLQQFGNTHSNSNQNLKNRKDHELKLNQLLQSIQKYIDMDKAADELAKNRIHDFLPPSLMSHEKQCSVHFGGEIMVDNGKVVNNVTFEADTCVRLIRGHCAR